MKSLALAIGAGAAWAAMALSSLPATGKTLRCETIAKMIELGDTTLSRALAVKCNPNSEYCEANPGKCGIAPIMTYERYCSRTTGVPCAY
jgi:hypothetical protein